MKTRTRTIVLSTVVIVISVIAGVGIGAYLGFSLGTSTVATVALNTQVHNLHSDIETLRALRNNELAAAAELIEKRLDRGIVSLLPEYRDGLRIDTGTNEFITQGVIAAKRYRADFPRDAQSELIRNDVQRAFSLVD